jgi:hypothetical protein
MSTNASPIVSSAAEMISALPTDAMSDLSSAAPETPAAPEPTAAPEEITAPESIEVPDTAEPEVEPEPEPEPEVQPEPEAEPEAEAPPATPETPAEELPDGVVRGKDSKGKEGLFVTPQRWQTIYGDHKAVREMSEAIGEPLTAEALKVRNDAFMGTERLYSDLFSGDPAAQKEVVNHFFEQAQQRLEAGEVGADPMVPFASTFYASLKERNGASAQGDPAYRDLRFSAAKDLVAELFHEAASTGDDNLLLSMQHVVRALSQAGREVTDAAMLRQIAERQGLPFYTKAEMPSLAKGKSPEALLRAENEALKAQLNGKQTTNQAAQFDQWKTQTRQQTNTAVLNDAITVALADAQKTPFWEKRQSQFEDLVTKPLHSEVVKVIAKDAAFNDRIALLEANAKRAVSAQKRAEIAEHIKQAHVNRARLAVDGMKAKRIADAAQTLKGLSDATHQRRQAAQQASAGPKGAATPPQHSLIPEGMMPKPGQHFDVMEQVKAAGKLLYGQ